MAKNYFNMYGSVSHCWKIHKRKMQELDLPWVTYATFRHRIVDLGWSLYKAIHTPAQIAKRDKDRRRKVRFYELRFKIEKFFRTIFKL